MPDMLGAPAPAAPEAADAGTASIATSNAEIKDVKRRCMRGFSKWEEGEVRPDFSTAEGLSRLAPHRRPLHFRSELARPAATPAEADQNQAAALR